MRTLDPAIVVVVVIIIITPIILSDSLVSGQRDGSHNERES